MSMSNELDIKLQESAKSVWPTFNKNNDSKELAMPSELEASGGLKLPVNRNIV